MPHPLQADALFDFNRIFRLLLGLVVLPTLVLASFGILAIANERAALENRLRIAYEERAAKVERELNRRLGTQAPPPKMDAANALLRQVVSEVLPDDSAQLLLVPATVQRADGRSMLDILRGLPGWSEQDSQSRAFDTPALVRRAMAVPLQGYVLEVYLPGEDPIGARTLRNTIIYSSLLVLFFALVIVGVVLTARFVYSEMRLSRLQVDFVSNISHELRTPLTSIRMFIETLQMGRARDEAEIQECLGIIAQESERLSRMIERILGWARMEAGRQGYHPEEIAVEGLLDQALQAFRTQQLQGPLDIHRQVAPDLPPLWVDPVAMSEALLNLLNNAFKYTGPEKHIAVKAYLLKGQVALEVADNGIGIAPKDRKRIFEKFYRADALLSRKTMGSGLGLTIVRHIVDAHRGKVVVESELGVGSRFILLLPPALVARDKLKG